jgi:hypothetical protein
MAMRKTGATVERMESAGRDADVLGDVPTSTGLTAEQIRDRAYFLSLERDAEAADPVGDWLRAERELSESA